MEWLINWNSGVKKSEVTKTFSLVRLQKLYCVSKVSHGRSQWWTDFPFSISKLFKPIEVKRKSRKKLLLDMKNVLIQFDPNGSS